ncbi:hypothetical protein FKM82_000001 [Ascaphus truei]
METRPCSLATHCLAQAWTVTSGPVQVSPCTSYRDSDTCSQSWALGMEWDYYRPLLHAQQQASQGPQMEPSPSHAVQQA